MQDNNYNNLSDNGFGRDGVAGKDRRLDPLSTDYIKVDERSLADFVRYLQKLSRQVKFAESDVTPDTWKRFLSVSEGSTVTTTSDSETDIDEPFIRGLIQFLRNPEKFKDDRDAYTRYSQPHRVLLWSFLNLMQDCQEQANQLTKRHLDFYYRTILQLTRRPAQADVVNVVIELPDDVRFHYLEEGTEFNAGLDTNGTPLVYKSEDGLIASRAQVVNVRNLYLNRTQTRLSNALEKGLNLSEIVKLALGEPMPGDPLPACALLNSKSKSDNDAMGMLIKLNTMLSKKATKDDALSYIQNSLFLSQDDFKFIVAFKPENESPGDYEWQDLLQRLRRAYNKRAETRRRDHLRAIVKKSGENSIETGFQDMLNYALGSPKPGDPLPVYQDNSGETVNTVYSALTSRDDADVHAADNYLHDELFMDAGTFKQIYEVAMGEKPNTVLDSQPWKDVFGLVEHAQRKKRDIQRSEPAIDELHDILAADICPLGKDICRTHAAPWKPFGENLSARHARSGFAVSSPILELAEGNRSINLYVLFDSLAPVTDISKDDLFHVLCSGKKGWFSPNTVAVDWGDFFLSKGRLCPTLNWTDDTHSKVSVNIRFFNDKDVGSYIINKKDGAIYQIASVTSGKKAMLMNVGQTTASSKLQSPQYTLFKPEEVCLNSLRLKLELTPADPAVCLSKDAFFTRASFPAIRIELKENGKGKFHYNQLKSLRMKRCAIHVSVENIRNYKIENDEGRLDPGKPFLPFGANAAADSSFYIAHPELCFKLLSTVTLNFKWLKLPKSFDHYYRNYNSFTNTPDYSTFNFQAYKVGHTQIPLMSEKEPLFGTSPNSVEDESGFYNEYQSAVSIELPLDQGENNHRDRNVGNNLREWSSYLKFQLADPDFQHSKYWLLNSQNALEISRQAITAVNNKTTPDYDDLSLNPPYTPALKELTFAYTATTEITFADDAAGLADNECYHTLPFGYAPVCAANQTGGVPFLAQYINEAELYLGLQGLELPQSVSILFQMDEGSGNPDLEFPVVSWSYLEQDVWHSLTAGQILSDTTRNLANSGIIRFDIPACDCSRQGMYPRNLFWLRASVKSNRNAIPDIVGVVSQAMVARFINQNNSPEHYNSPLQPGTITKLTQTDPNVRAIKQPYASRLGKGGEDDESFYVRGSERLRHRGRAVTCWDYERMVLDAFPEIYKVKCLPAGYDDHLRRGIITDIGKVILIVIPDVRGQRRFDPLRPKLAADSLAKIKMYLTTHVSPFVTIEVRNPVFVQVKLRFTAVFKDGWNDSSCIDQLNRELIRYFSPWGYDSDMDIEIGATISDSQVIHFINARPYVDYLTNLNFFQTLDGTNFVRMFRNTRGEISVGRDYPNAILTSAANHDIDVLSGNGYKDEDFHGIGYMRTGLDFQVKG